MLEHQILIRAGIKKHKGSLLGIGILLFLTALSLTAVLMTAFVGNCYIREEMERLGFGDLTAWASNVPDADFLTESIRGQEGVEAAETQRLIFSEYEANGMESDSEGQLIPWTGGRYRFFQSDLSGYAETLEEIGEEEVYVSASMKSMMDLKPGDAVTFPIARGGRKISLTVAGYYEDPFMGSSMIGMKGFLISEQAYDEICSVIEEAGMDALARDGVMIHIQMEEGRTVSEINRTLIENTPLSMYTEFIHSADTIAGFMVILQDAFSAILAAFAFVLLGVAMAVMGHSISGLVQQEWKNLGILKTIGFTGKQLAGQLMVQYMGAVGFGAVSGMLLAVPAAGIISRVTVTTTGVLLPIHFPVLPCLGILAVLLLVPGGFCALCIRRVDRISPMAAIRRESGEAQDVGAGIFHHKLRAEGLSFHLALRQVLTGRKRYTSACLVAALLVFFASLAGRMNGWLGADGKGMMDAFNPADLDLGVQVLGKLSAEEMETMVLSYTDITDSYLLAMPSVSVNGTNYTANVITEPERFHISRGHTSRGADQVVLTEVLAADLGADVGDTVTIRGNKGSGVFIVSGIYHCANDMGANLGMSREGYLSIGEDDSRLWCCHYFLEDPSQKQAITEALEQTWSGDVHVHENSWPGLFGIISAMHMLILFLYGMSAAFICIVTGMAGTKILDAEQKDMGIYKSIGCSVRMLRLSFAFRFGLVAGMGAVIGTLAAMGLTDPIVSSLMRLAGISNFVSGNTPGSVLLPGIVMILLFFGFAWLLSGRIGKEEKKMTEESNASNPMGTERVSGLVLRTGVPLMISLLINSLYNFVDSVFVSRISEEALTALSLAAPVQILMSAMGLGIAVGLNAVISKALGEGDQEKVKKTASAALVLAFLAWVLVSLLEVSAMRPYFRWQSGGNETIMDYGIPYLRICMLGSLGMMGQWVFDRFVMASGKSSLFLFTLSAASITNLILDPILIFGYFGIPAMGTAGAALATVIGQWVGCFAGYGINCRWNREIPIHFTAKADKGCMAAILKVGIPSTLVQAVSSVLAIYVNSVLMVITPTAVAVYGACVKIQGLVTVGVNGMGSGLIPIVAYNYGAKKPKRIYQSCRWAMLYSVIFYSIFFLIMEVFPEWVLLLFDASPEMLSIGVTALRILAVSHLLSNVCLIYSAAFQGLGLGVQSMLLTLGRQVVLPVVFIAAFSHFGNPTWIWLAFVLAEAVVIPIGIILWRRESDNVLKNLKREENRRLETQNKNSNKLSGRQMLVRYPYHRHQERTARWERKRGEM